MTLNLVEVKSKMQKSLETFQHQLSGVGEFVNIKLVGTVKIKDDTGHQSIEDIALLNKKDFNISVVPYNPQSIHIIEQALKQNGFNAFVFSKTTVVVSIAPPSSEEKNKIIMYLKKLSEDAKVSIRNIRKIYRQKNKDEDDGQINLLTDGYIFKIDEIINKKIKNLA